MALAAMANTASIVSGSSSSSGANSLFVNSSAVNIPYSHTPGGNHLLPQHISAINSSESAEIKKECIPLIAPSVNLPTTPIQKNQGSTPSALKAALQASDQSSFVVQNKSSQ